MIFTNSDGGARGNPGPGAIGVVIREDNKILHQYAEVLKGKVTNNVAEYMGLIRALEIGSRYTKKEITCILDSELIVKQLLGEYKVRNSYLMELFLKVQKLQERFEKISYKHVRREDDYQKAADYLLNVALDKRYGSRRVKKKMNKEGVD
ncbi:MAG: ribonuclease HI family protein [Nanoarchaeota archaeon]|nr:ribonuclease HI family protein [Nanoarchaeota archaeon]